MTQNSEELAQLVIDTVLQLPASQLEKVLIFALGVEAGAKKEG